jgi:hypothetical protein
MALHLSYPRRRRFRASTTALGRSLGRGAGYGLAATAGGGSSLASYAAKGADARRERVAVVLDDVVKLFGESGGFFVCQVKVHGASMLL